MNKNSSVCSPRLRKTIRQLVVLVLGISGFIGCSKPNDSDSVIIPTTSIELLTLDGHPKLYDSAQAAQSFWGPVADGRIIFPNTGNEFDFDKTVISYSAYQETGESKDKSVIRDIELYPKEYMSLDEALELTKSYLPIDELNNWYQISESEKYHSTDKNETMYMVLYVPTEEGKKAIDEIDSPFNYVEVIIQVNNDTVNLIRISSTNIFQGRHYKEYEELSWEHDFRS